MDNAKIPNGKPGNYNEEGPGSDPDYEGPEDSEDEETFLTKDGGLSTVNEARPSNLPPKTRNISAISQERNS